MGFYQDGIWLTKPDRDFEDNIKFEKIGINFAIEFGRAYGHEFKGIGSALSTEHWRGNKGDKTPDIYCSQCPVKIEVKTQRTPISKGIAIQEKFDKYPRETIVMFYSQPTTEFCLTTIDYLLQAKEFLGMKPRLNRWGEPFYLFKRDDFMEVYLEYCQGV